jgi:hypothetical protein
MVTAGAGVDVQRDVAMMSCLVLVKMYGNSPKKLFVRIVRNRDVRMNEFPLFSFPFLKIVFISWCNLFINKFTIMLFRDGTSQILVGINRSCTCTPAPAVTISSL